MESATDLSLFETQEGPPRTTDGKDELNLAEFPLCSLSDRTSEQKTLVFEDKTWDASRGDMVSRQLTITASAEHGLPTALDDEVLLGLIQLSKLQDFATRSVSFTRYQLIQLLGWRNDGKSYARIETSLNRWAGVTLYYKNAWWSKVNKCWADEKFHILDNVTLLDAEQVKRKGALESSSFSWNQVVFHSFQAGNLKSLDFDFYKSLHSAISKRLYRFLDKRFWRRDRWEFDVKEIAWAHVGLARSYDITNLKRRLNTGIDELVNRGYLAPMPECERFQKLSTGVWRVVFTQNRKGAQTKAVSEFPLESREPIVRALVERGVGEFAAESLTKSNSLESIKVQLEVFDWLTAQGDPRVSKNPPGFLVSSIKGAYEPPKGFVSRGDDEARRKKVEERKRKADERKKREEEEQEKKEVRREDAIRNFWASLSNIEKEQLEEEAFSNASTIHRQLLERGGAGAVATRKALLDAYALKMLQVG